MQYNRGKFVIIAGIILSLVLLGVFSIQALATPDNGETYASGFNSIVGDTLGGAQAANATSTATATSTPEPADTPSTGEIDSRSTTSVNQWLAFEPEIFSFIEAPGEVVERPYVLLSSFQSIPGGLPLSIRGTVNFQEFVCYGTPCILPISEASIIEFWGFLDNGEVGEKETATVQVVQQQDGYLVTLNASSELELFEDTCAAIWGFTRGTSVGWAVFPDLPGDLSTQKKLHFLAARLIQNDIVDASDCPSGGIEFGAPNGCGIERAMETMTLWQNQYDFHIWLSARTYGIPPKIVKTLIEIESQYWPHKARNFIDEYGLGQINENSVDLLLRRNTGLYQTVCPAVLSDCSVPYTTLSPTLQAMIRGAALEWFIVDCPHCDYGFDLEKAKQSVPFISLLLETNCGQTKAIVNRYSVLPSYEDNWKFTLVSFHKGIGCLQYAIDETARKGLPINWEYVSQEIRCAGGVEYVDRFWTALTTFDSYLLNPHKKADIEDAVSAVFVPTPTPVPTSTPVASTAQIHVYVIHDKNANGHPDAEEWLQNVSVEVTLSTGLSRTQKTINGTAVFDMSQLPIGTQVTISLPGLYRTETLALPRDGVIPVIFVFTQAEMPERLP